MAPGEFLNKMSYVPALVLHRAAPTPFWCSLLAFLAAPSPFQVPHSKPIAMGHSFGLNPVTFGTFQGGGFRKAEVPFLGSECIRVKTFPLYNQCKISSRKAWNKASFFTGNQLPISLDHFGMPFLLKVIIAYLIVHILMKFLFCIGLW